MHVFTIEIPRWPQVGPRWPKAPKLTQNGSQNRRFSSYFWIGREKVHTVYMNHSSFNKTCSLDFPVGFAPTGSGKSPKGLNGSGKSPKGLNGFSVL